MHFHGFPEHGVCLLLDGGEHLELLGELPEELCVHGGLDGAAELVQEEPVAEVAARLDAGHMLQASVASAVLEIQRVSVNVMVRRG